MAKKREELTEEELRVKREGAAERQRRSRARRGMEIKRKKDLDKACKDSQDNCGKRYDVHHRILPGWTNKILTKTNVYDEEFWERQYPIFMDGRLPVAVKELRKLFPGIYPQNDFSFPCGVDGRDISLLEIVKAFEKEYPNISMAYKYAMRDNPRRLAIFLIICLLFVEDEEVNRAICEAMMNNPSQEEVDQLVEELLVD